MKEFQNEVKEHLEFCRDLCNKYNYNLIKWWEAMIKPGIKKIAILKTKEHNISRYGKLNMLFMKQAYFNSLVHNRDVNAKIQLQLINLELNTWFTKEAKSILRQINMQEIDE